MAQLKMEGVADARELSLPPGQRLLYVVSSNGDPRHIQLVRERPEKCLAALLHVGGHWLVLAPTTGASEVAIDGIPIPGLKILDDKSVLTVAGINLRLMERIEEMLAADSAAVRQKKACPYCQRILAAGDSVIYCPTCGLAHHATCIRLGKHCASYPFCGYNLPDEAGQEN